MLIHPDAFDIAAVAARQVARRYRNRVDLEDVRSECHLWLTKHPHKVEEWLSDDLEAADRKAGAAKLALSLRRAADRWCRKEKAVRSGYRPGDEFFYTPSMVQELLPAAFNHDQWSLAAAVEDDGPKRKTQPSEGGNVMAMLSDVRTALRQLEPDEKILMWELHHRRLTQKELAGKYGIAESTMSERLGRIYERMVDLLGGASPWVRGEGLGSRSVVSNAQAQAITRNQYE